jgi:hypothetical protein
MKAIARSSAYSWIAPGHDTGPDEKVPVEREGANGWARAGLIFAVWTLLGLFDASHSIIRYASAGDPVAWYNVLAMCLALWYCWAFLAFFVFRLARRYPFDGRNWPRRLALHLAACVFFAFVKMVMDYPIIWALYCPEPDKLTMLRFMRMAFNSQFQTYVLIYWAMVGVCHAFDYHRKLRDRELKAARLETRLAQAQLHLLKMQLHPHFLFNTLNAISALIHRDLELADRMVARLGELLRLTMDNAGTHEVTLAQELEFIEAYLEIERVRFGPRLTVRWEIEPQTRSAWVPYLLLQPLVENAIRHAIAPRPGPGLLEIRAERVGETLVLQVSDDGPGLPPCRPNGRRHGIGLANTRARLEQLYGEAHRFEMGRSDLGGVCVTIETPFCLEERRPAAVALLNGD